MVVSIPHILIVDDQENWRQALRALLEKEGFQISEASHVDEAKNILMQTQFHLVVIDLRLKDKETYNVQGLELLNYVKSQTPNTKTVVLTAYPESLKGKQPDADAFILKVPQHATFDTKGFRSKIRELLQN